MAHSPEHILRNAERTAELMTQLEAENRELRAYQKRLEAHIAELELQLLNHHLEVERRASNRPDEASSAT